MDKFKTNRNIYFKYNNIHLLEKCFLYAKRLLFNEKNYDLCDNFDSLIKSSGKSYYIYCDP